jgi:amidase
VHDVLSVSAVEQAGLVRSRAISAAELTRAYLARIERIDPQLSAFTHVLGRGALREARRKDVELARRDAGHLPPFHGVPLAVKDLNFVRGSFTRMGSRAYRWFYSPFDDRVVAQLRRGGFVILGKASTAELGAMPVTEPAIHRATRNPWNPEISPGGSSGGSAAAVAAGLVPIAQGSDGAGSIRIPSSFCHLYGFKPSRGRVANPYGRPDQHIISTCGPIARTVGDAAAMIDVMAGLSVGTPHWAPRPDRCFSEMLDRPPTGLRVRFTISSPLVVPHPDVAAALHQTAQTLSDLGHLVEEGSPPVGELEEFLPVWQFLISRAPVFRSSSLQPVTAWLREAGRRLRAETVLERQKMLEQKIVGWFGDADLWLTPTVAVPPPPIGAWRDLPPDQAFTRAAVLGAFTALFNISGQPAATVPVGLGSGGWPIGAQIAGRPLADQVVLAVSRQLEQAMPWAARRPAID